MKNIGCIILLVVLLCSSLFSQTKILSFSDCLDLAIQQSYRIQRSNSEIQAGLSALSSAKSAYYPHLFAALSYDQLLYSDYNFRRQMTAAYIDWSIGDWLKNTADVKAGQVEVLRAEREYSTIEVIVRVAGLYMEILLDQRKLELLDERMGVLHEHLKVADALWQGGIRTRLDVLQTHNEIKTIEEQNLRLQSEKQNRQSELAYLLDKPIEDLGELRDFPETVVEVEPVLNLPALEQNPLLHSLQLQAETQKLRLREVSADNMPRLQIQGGYVADADLLADGNYWQVGIGLQMALFRWNNSKYRREEINAHIKSLQLQKAQAKRELAISQSHLREQLSYLRRLFFLQQEKLEITMLSLEIATANYQAGLITNLEFLHAQEQDLANHLALNMTRLTYVMRLIAVFALTNEVDKIKALHNEWH